jgi:hypothetical protein
MRFAELDRAILRQLVFDPACEPSYELMKSCLVWPDERPLRISREGYELLGDLWAVRGFLHRGIPLSQWGLDPTYFQTVGGTRSSMFPNGRGSNVLTSPRAIARISRHV